MKTVDCPHCDHCTLIDPFVGVATIQCPTCSGIFFARTDGVSFEASSITVSKPKNGYHGFRDTPRRSPQATLPATD